jgi:hypothetical protein
LIEWQPDASELPNSVWFAKIYRYLSSLDEDDLPVDELRNIPLVPGNDGFLYTPGNSSTPLWPTAKANTSLLATLEYFGIPFVQADQQELSKAISILINKHSETLIWPLTGSDVVDSLAGLKTFPDVNKKHYRSLISFLASERSWLDSDGDLDDKNASRLKGFPIYFTADGDPTDLDDVYLPGGYEPPTLASSVKLMHLGSEPDSYEWKPLFDALGIPVLSRSRLILDYLLPKYEDLNEGDQLSALTWIRDNLGQAQGQLEETKQDSKVLKQAIMQAEIIRCNDGELRAASHIYVPGSYKVVQKILGDRTYTPDMNFYGEGEHLWEDFFKTLEMLKTPSASDLVAYIDDLIYDSESSGIAAVEETLKDLFRHILTHLGDLQAEELRGSMSWEHVILCGRKISPV